MSELQDTIRSLAFTLRVKPAELDFLQRLEAEQVTALHREVDTALASRHHAFKQSLRHAGDRLPRMLRRPVRKLFR